MASMRKCTWFACLFSVACIAGIVSPIPKVDALVLQTRANVNGILYCTINGGIGANGSATQVFPNATMQFRCGSGNILSTTTTNGNGVFSISADVLSVPLLSVLSGNCNLVVTTPLINCNASLPNVTTLMAPLRSPTVTLQVLCVTITFINPFSR